MSEFENIKKANNEFVQSFKQGSLPTPPGRKIAVVTCMDARIDPAQALGLKIGDAHVIRNAGGLTTEDAIRSLIISYKLLGTKEFYVVGHTDCGMLTFQNEGLQNTLKHDTGHDAAGIDFLPFSDLRENLRKQVDTIRSHPLIPRDIPVHGLIYHVESGELEHVVTLKAEACQVA